MQDRCHLQGIIITVVITVADTILTEVPLIKIILGIEMVETYIALIAQLEICIVEEA
jgi:hypothetical protein